jgi:hypothetical protein
VAISRKLLVSSSLAFASIACAADTSLLNLVMPNAKVLFGANVERILDSQIGKAIGSEIQAKLPELQQVLQKAGFDPAHDIKEVLIAAGGKGQNGPALFLVRGSFNSDKIKDAVSGTGRVPHIYEGVPILENPSKTHGAFAFLDGTIAVGGDLDQVRAAIRRRTHPTELTEHMAAQVDEISNRYDIWVIAAAPLGEMTSGISGPQLQQAGDLIKAVQEVSGGLKFSANLDLGAELTTRSEKDAEKLRDTLQFLVGLAAASQKEASAIDPSALKFTTDSKTVRIALTVTGEQLKKTYELQMARWHRADTHDTQPPARDTGVTIQTSERDMGTVVVSSAK